MNFDAEPRKLRRNDGPDTSQVSAATTRARENNERAYYIVQKALTHGATADDVRREWVEHGGHPRASIFPRLTNIHDEGLILDTGLRRASDAGRPMAIYIARVHLTESDIAWIKQNPKAHNRCLEDKEPT